MLAVVGHQPLDQVDLLQGDLHGVLVLGPTGRVGHPQLRWVGKDIPWMRKVSLNTCAPTLPLTSLGMSVWDHFEEAQGET